MKKRYIAIEFLLVLVFLVLPPLFVTKGYGLSKSTSLSLEVAVKILMTIAFYMQMKFLFSSGRDQSNNSHNKFSLLVRRLFWFSITLGILMLVFALMQALTFVTSGDSLAESFVPTITSIKAFAFVALTVGAGAFYEEVIYRQLIPEFLFELLGTLKNKKIAVVSCEAIALLLFAFAHRYLGWIAVLNSFLCGIILRLCFRKTGSAITGSLVHFTYNMTLVIFSSLI